MKVLQINSVCGYGSTGRIVADLGNAIEEQGDISFIAYGRGKADKRLNTFRVGSDHEVRMHGIITRITDKHGFGSKIATEKFIREMEIFNADIIHLHNIHGYYINIETLFNYLKDENKPVVWTLHDCWSFTGHCSHFDYVGCERWKTGCYRCPQKHMYPESKLIDNSKWNYEKKKDLFTSIKNMVFVTPSCWLYKLVKESFLGEYPVRIINNGINLNAFQPAAFTERLSINMKDKYGCTGKFVILGVASIWEERKGMEYLLELSRRLNDRYRLMIVGITEKQKASLPSNVIGITRTNDIDQLAEIYTMADVFVNPTLEEVLGLTNLEALACGTPVITFKTGGSPECIDESCGRVVEKGDIDGLVRAIQIIKENPINQEACVARAQLFNKDDKYLEYLSLYRQMLQ